MYVYVYLCLYCIYSLVYLSAEATMVLINFYVSLCSFKCFNPKSPNRVSPILTLGSLVYLSTLRPTPTQWCSSNAICICMCICTFIVFAPLYISLLGKPWSSSIAMLNCAFKEVLTQRVCHWEPSLKIVFFWLLHANRMYKNL